MKNILKKFLIGTLVVVAFVITANLALASYDFGPTILKVGSTGQYVITLQALVGATPADGNFGPITKAKVVAWQKAHSLTADGLFGPVSKAKANETGTNFGAGCTKASGFSAITGFPCSSLNANVFPAGCTNASGFSATTGLACSSGGNVNANVFPAGCTNASGFSATTGFSCLTGFPRVQSVISGGGGHHATVEAVQAPALANGLTFADDNANDTNTLITLGAPSVGGNTFAYLISSDANAVPALDVGDDLSAWAAVVNGASITAVNGKHIGVAEVNGSNLAVQFSDATAVTEVEAVPVIATVSTIASGKIDPSGIVITLTGDTFIGGITPEQVSNWTVNYGATNLVLENYGSTLPIVRNSDTQVTLNFHGMATPGTITLQAKAVALTGGGASNQISIIIAAAGFNPATSAVYTTSSATTAIIITLAEGSFRADGVDPIDKNDFNFAGTDAIAIVANGTFTRLSNTIVKIMGLDTHLAGGSNNTVTVLGATQASQVTTVTGTVE